MNGEQMAAAWEAWKKTDEGKRCLDGKTDGEYLKNRLWYAFMAGIGQRLAVTATLRTHLRVHYLRAIECHHESHTDTPHCACCAWPCDPQPSVAEAVERWVEHFMTTLEESRTP